MSKILTALITALVIGTALVATASAQSRYDYSYGPTNEFSRDRVCATGCSGF